jgi:DNA polymerase
MAGTQTAQWTTQDVADSFALWWRDAGLHSLVSAEPHGWLERDEPLAMTAQAATLPAPTVPSVAPRPAVTRRPMPADLAGFCAWLAEDATQPETAWSGPVWLPSARTGAPLAIIVDMPDAGADDPTLPFAPPVRQFLAAMLRAIGLRLEDAAIAPLAMRRPPGGLLDDPTHGLLSMRMRHYLGLAAPRAALVLGDRTSRALLAAQAPGGNGNLPFVKHDSGTIPAVALPSAEHLMRRPAAKAASWQALRLITGAIAP